MVVLIRELVNTLFFTSFTTLQHFPIASLTSNINIDININIIRERSTFFSRIISRESSTYFNVFTTPYHKKIEIQNNLSDKDIQKLINSFQLLYVLNKE